MPQPFPLIAPPILTEKLSFPMETPSIVVTGVHAVAPTTVNVPYRALECYPENIAEFFMTMSVPSNVK
jgi:hypothetical protein